MIVLFIVASGLFWTGVVLDANSSMGQMEGTKLFRDKDGRFSLKRYMAFMVGSYALVTVIAVYLDDSTSWIMASASLILGAVLRFWVAKRNRALRKDN